MREFLKVAKGILDDAAEESLEVNLASADAVQAYADSINVALSDEAALKIIEVCNAWIDGTSSGILNGSHDFYYTVSQPLDELENA